MKSNKSISQKNFLTKIHFLPFQKWPKIKFWIIKSWKRVLWSGLFLIFWPTVLEEISQFKNLEPLPKKNHLGLDQNMSAFFFLCRIWSVFSDDRMAKKQFFFFGYWHQFPNCGTIISITVWWKYHNSLVWYRIS